MVAELEEVRLSKTALNDDDFDYGAAVPLHAAAFRNYGIDVLTLDPAEAATRIRASRIRVELTAALDDWTYLNGPRGVMPPQEVRRLHEIALAADPDGWRSRMREAVRRRDLQALRDAAKSADVVAWPGATLNLLGEALAKSGDVPASVALLRRAQLAHPNDAWINHNLACSLRKLDPPLLDDALRYHVAAWALRAESPGMAYNVAHALDQKGALDEAIATYREAIRLKSDYAKARTNLGADLLRKGLREEALAELRKAIRLKPDLVQAHYNLGVALHAKGETDAAIAAYREAIRLRPNYALGYYSLGLLAQEGGKFDEAIDYYRQAIKCRNDLVEAHGNLGAALRKKGRLDEALAECRETVRLAPTSATAHCNLANALAAKKDFQGAIDEHREALRLNPDYAEAHCNLGIVLLGLGRHVEALAELRRGHELGSKQPRWSYPSAEWVRQAEQLAKESIKNP
jgi:tetratricopeptide (TPR) repeat protein